MLHIDNNYFCSKIFINNFLTHINLFYFNLLKELKNN
jgi:hypothetical protein